MTSLSEKKSLSIASKALDLPAPLERVDFLVSEWMGYGLLYESMLPTLIHARDRFLAPGGAVLPSACSLLLVGSSHNRLAFFDDVYGLSPPRSGMRLLVFQLALDQGLLV